MREFITINFRITVARFCIFIWYDRLHSALGVNGGARTYERGSLGSFLDKFFLLYKFFFTIYIVVKRRVDTS